MKEISFSTILPPELKAKRTVFIFRIEKHIFDHSGKEIEGEIIKENPWLQSVEQINKFPNRNILKIQFTTTRTTKKATEYGLLALCMSIPEYRIKLEEYTPISICIRCYKLDDHFSSNCPKDHSYKICSECAATGHTWRESLTDVKKWINSSGPHRTLAYKCPKKKKIREAKSTYTMKKTKQTYSQAATNNTNISQLNLHINKDTTATIICMIHAHLTNLADPGSYDTAVEKLMTNNSLP